jgi:hypothetical protein
MELAERLQSSLTQRLAAFCLGLGDGRIIGEFARDEKSPDKSMIDKMENLIKIVAVIEKCGDSKIVQIWFMGSNDFLGISPAQMLKSDFYANLVEVLNAAHAFAEN